MLSLRNGRPATQSDLDALEGRFNDRLDRLESTVVDTVQDHGRRLVALEVDEARDDARAEAASVAQEAATELRQERVGNRQWRVGIAIGIASIAIANLISLAALLR